MSNRVDVGGVTPYIYSILYFLSHNLLAIDDYYLRTMG